MKHKKILPHHHTGRVVHHRHTSYGGLVFVLLLAIAVLVFASRSVALAAATDPVTGTYSTYAVVPGPAPAVAPTINTVISGAVFTTAEPIDIGGTCPDGSLIKIYKNAIFGGASICESGSYTVPMNLFIGVNTLIARAYNTNNIPGPESTPVVANRNIQGTNTPTAAANQFFLTSDIYYKGVNVGEELVWPVTVSGGQAPYAVSVGWGDGKTDLISRKDPGDFRIAHTYGKSGEGEKPHHNITVTATDQTGEMTFMQLVTIVNGDRQSVVSSVKKGYDISMIIRIAWQVMLGIALLVLSFWLGERREVFILKRAAAGKA